MDGLVHLANLISDGVHSLEMSRRLVNQGATIPVVLAVSASSPMSELPVAGSDRTTSDRIHIRWRIRSSRSRDFAITSSSSVGGVATRSRRYSAK
jgi:hypothetical protein